MQPTTWKKIEQIFNEATRLPRESQTAFVEEKSGGVPDIRENVLRLLAQDNSGKFFLDDPLFTLGSQLLIGEEDEDLIEKETFAGYRLLQIIGRGGMGIVYLAYDTRLNRRVALKLLPASLNREFQSVSRFRQEARAASKVVHKNVAHIYDFGEYEDRCFLAMEYVPGQTLRELLKEKRIELHQAIDITLQIASALHAAHRAGVVHRDIKPENIVVLDDGQVKVLDFGLAKITQAKTADNLETSLETIPGLIMGTTAYMSPEQVRGQAADETTDLWSLGVIFYEMLAGGRPFRGDTLGDIQAAILKDEPFFDSPLLPLELTGILRKLLNKKAAERCRNAQELILELEEIRLRPLSYQTSYLNQSLSTNPNYQQNTAGNNRPNSFAKNTSDPKIKHFEKNRKNFIFAFVSLLIAVLSLGAVYFFLVSPEKIASEDVPSNTLSSVSSGVSQNPQALREYQMGQHIWNKRQVVDMPKALVHFQRAIELDPGFAPAYVGLANAYQWGGNPNLTQDERHNHVKASLQRALAIDPNSVEARATLAFTLGGERDWHGAEREYLKAIEIDPNYPTTYIWYAEFLAVAAGRDDEAVEHIERAHKLDPLSFAVLSNSVGIYYFVGRYDEAIAKAEKMITFDPRFEQNARAWMARLYAHKGDIEKAKKEFRKYDELSDGKLSDAERGNYFSLFGEREKALGFIKKVENSPDAIKEALMLASSYSHLGMPEEAFKWLEIAFDNNNPSVTTIAASPDFDNLHSDPRFIKLLARINMADFWKDKLNDSK